MEEEDRDREIMRKMNGWLGGRRGSRDIKESEGGASFIMEMVNYGSVNIIEWLLRTFNRFMEIVGVLEY